MELLRYRCDYVFLSKLKKESILEDLLKYDKPMQIHKDLILKIEAQVALNTMSMRLDHDFPWKLMAIEIDHLSNIVYYNSSTFEISIDKPESLKRFLYQNISLKPETSNDMKIIKLECDWSVELNQPKNGYNIYLNKITGEKRVVQMSNYSKFPSPCFTSSKDKPQPTVVPAEFRRHEKRLYIKEGLMSSLAMRYRLLKEDYSTWILSMLDSYKPSSYYYPKENESNNKVTEQLLQNILSYLTDEQFKMKIKDYGSFYMGNNLIRPPRFIKECKQNLSSRIFMFSVQPLHERLLTCKQLGKINTIILNIMKTYKLYNIFLDSFVKGMLIEIGRYFYASRRLYDWKGPWEAVKEVDFHSLELLWEKRCVSSALDDIFPFQYIAKQEEIVKPVFLRADHYSDKLNLLQFAAMCGRYDCCEFLLKIGMNVDHRNEVRY